MSMPMHHHHSNFAGNLLMNQASGTSLNPQSWRMPMWMAQAGSWNLMLMGDAFIVDTQQSGPRGGDKLYSASMSMLGAEHSIGRGSIMLETMLSLEPLTVADRRYPLLFQTGETAYGRPLVDAQHPHNFVMDLGIHYARPVGAAVMQLYYAPVGDPALGPVAYPHRASAAELPQAPIGHHWQDSTHIATNVVTAAVRYRKLRLEASGFHGAEPGENRWTINWGGVDSWSTRFSVMPTGNWLLQVSQGRLADPERTHAGTVQRTWGLDATHDRSGTASDVRMQQATINLLADMGAQPATLRPGLVSASASTDTTAPTSTITAPANGASVGAGTPVAITGTAADTGGGVVGGVEISVDGGTTWHPATGRANWMYNWTPSGSGSVTLRSRAVDDSGNLGGGGAGNTVTIGARS